MKRAIISTLLLVFFLSTALSGFGLLFAGYGTGIRHTLKAIHFWGGVIFVVLALIHFALNFKTYVCELKNRI